MTRTQTTPEQLPVGWSRSARGAPGAFRRKSAFTLTELLVVIAIMMVLAGLLMPVLGAVKRRALHTTCLSNVRQLVSATILYTADSDTLLPIYINNEYVLCHYDPECAYPPTDSTFPEQLRTVLSAYKAPGEIFRCPDVRDRSAGTVRPEFGDYTFDFGDFRNFDVWPRVMSIDSPILKQYPIWRDDLADIRWGQHSDQTGHFGYTDGHVLKAVKGRSYPMFDMNE